MEDNNNIPEDFENLQKHAPTLSKIEKKNCFTVPHQYFNEFPENIQRIIYLLNLKNENPFDVPDVYFEQLPEHIQQIIFIEQLKNENAFSAPENYFDTLSEKIQSRIFVETLKEDTLEIPSGYFDELPTIIQQKIFKEKETRVFSIGEWFKTQYGYVAAAASVALLIGFLFLNRSDISPDKEINIALTENQKQYVKENTELFDMDESLLASTVSNEELTELRMQGLSKNEVWEYLSNENTSDISSIIE